MLSRDMRRRSIGLCFSLLLACGGGSGHRDSAAFPALPAPDDGSPVAERLGVSMGVAWGADPDAVASRVAAFAKLHELGIHRVRTDFTWHSIEREKGVFDYSALDAMVDDASHAGIELLAIADYSNPLYPTTAGNLPGTGLPGDVPGADLYPPTDPAPFAEYVRRSAERYGARVAEWEIWNEENIGYRFWRPWANAGDYARLARAAATAGRSACSSCTFVLGGMSMPQPIPKINAYPPGPVYLPLVLDAAPDLADWVDAVAFHPYQYPKDAPEFETAPFPDRVEGSLATQHATLARILLDAGLPRPLWITENGWPTNPGVPQSDDDFARIFGLDPALVSLGRLLLGAGDFGKVVETLRGVDEAAQARYTVRAILIAAALGVPRTFIYTLEDGTFEPDIDQESVFGVYRADGSPKPAVAALAALTSILGPLRFAGDASAALGLADPDRALAFGDGTATVLALWRWTDGSSTLHLAALPGDAELLDQQGTSLAHATRGNAIDVSLGPDVVYLRIAG